MIRASGQQRTLPAHSDNSNQHQVCLPLYAQLKSDPWSCGCGVVDRAAKRRAEKKKRRKEKKAKEAESQVPRHSLGHRKQQTEGAGSIVLTHLSWYFHPACGGQVDAEEEERQRLEEARAREAEEAEKARKEAARQKRLDEEQRRATLFSATRAGELESVGGVSGVREDKHCAEVSPALVVGR